ncbi:hypothetical protein ACUYF2_24435 (plasmid) [Escherichia coli]
MNKTKGCLIANFATVPALNKTKGCLIANFATVPLKLIRFTGESAIAFSLLSGQKVNGHIGLPA